MRLRVVEEMQQNVVCGLTTRLRAAETMEVVITSCRNRASERS